MAGWFYRNLKSKGDQFISPENPVIPSKKTVKISVKKQIFFAFFGPFRY